MSYTVLWMLETIGAMTASAFVVWLGASLLRGVAEDLSNSTRWSSYLLRAFRALPGAALAAVGCALLWRLIAYVVSLPFPHP